ncbi:hypothetical protein MM221_14265 [Salipaludibacillus sp. LMS25]|uniref:hypothetical protein n=1 Tax=Salipaludibacillus sp. LMS25 TaxID=2924031 RepID=UPI0020D0DA2F|nr:hypothetical protein [Salipaludibacillus sp. LMS25]UTR13770.1 hypothetical protein MM221_14265 [Salipaludibacillus sp. LMS25]
MVELALDIFPFQSCFFSPNNSCFFSYLNYQPLYPLQVYNTTYDKLIFFISGLKTHAHIGVTASSSGVPDTLHHLLHEAIKRQTERGDTVLLAIAYRHNRSSCLHRQSNVQQFIENAKGFPIEATWWALIGNIGELVYIRKLQSDYL